MMTVPEESWETAGAVLRLARQLIDGIQEGLARRGFTDVRPAHGFAFVRISAGDARTADVAEHLEDHETGCRSTHRTAHHARLRHSATGCVRRPRPVADAH